ncbi:glycosyltransferase family 4 protein [Paraliomyxa miuraensis]|uniref:glycosyltransferase family 4 protein n=1 Tax=Paraliomyxa miuraensis TaxID=376150 RepID=UPI0022547828|nr:glycosyltransferase family 4 protein [Paraliomyxa miuraensis]MCX4246341.1 glycosyltransferase family 4 protein [Paraliomyxa miuraensis]
MKDTRLRIAFVITRSDAVGGAQIHVRDLAGALHDEGHVVRVWVGGHGPFVELLRQRGVEVRSLRHLVAPIDPVRDLRAVLELRRELARFAPELVTLHSSKAGALGRLAARGLGAAVVYTAHGWPFVEGVPPRQAAVYRVVERLAAPLADRIITVSEHDRRLAERAGVGRAGQVVRVHNGVLDVDASLRARPSEGPVRLCAVARLDVPKDPFTVLHALHRLRAHRSAGAFTLEWIGDGPLRAAAEQLVASLGLADCCRFVGTQGDVAQRLAAASVLVLSTDREGLPLCVLEGMRAGLPVVASAVGGIPEAVEAGCTGVLVPPRDRRAWARALGSLIDDPRQRARLGAAGRTRYETHFSFERQREATLDVYRSLCTSGPAPLGWERDVAASA